MKLPTSLTVTICATGSLWVVAILAYVFEQRTEIVVGAFLLGCVTARVEAIKQLG